MKRTALKKKPKPKSWTWWRDKAWKTFSKWIRERDGGKCFTCDRLCEGSGYHAGHYHPRSVSTYLLFDPRNVRGQCYNCNINKSGNSDEFAVRLGDEMVKELRADKYKYKQWCIEDFQNIIKRYETNPK